MKHIIFFDIDGTLRDFDGWIPDSAITAIRESRKKGNYTVICSGRARCHIEPDLFEIGFDGVISGAGSYTEFGGACISRKVIPDGHLQKLTEVFVKKKCILEFMNYKEHFVLEQQRELYEKMHDRTMVLNGIKKKPSTKNPIFVSDVNNIHGIEKITYSGDYFSHEEVKVQLGDLVYFVPHSVPHNYKYGGEMSVAGVDKGYGVRKILENIDMEKSRAYALGDSLNDLDMFSEVGIKIAMGNATDPVKAAADYVTAPLREDGLKKALDHFSL